MSRWLNKKFGTSWGAAKWSILLGISVLSLCLVVYLSVVFATTTTWNLSTAGDYQCEKTDNNFEACSSSARATAAGPTDEIIVVGGVAKLVNDYTVTQNTEALFDTGTFSNTESVSGPDGVQFTQAVVDAASAGSPATGTYTSLIFNSGIPTTTWKTLTHSRALQSGTPPATFANVATVTSSIVTVIQNFAVADFNRDGAIDVGINAESTSTDSTFFWYQNANPPPNPFTKRWIVDDTGPTGSPCTGSDGISTSGTGVPPRPLFFDFDNDLDPDVVDPRTRINNGSALFYNENPYSSGGGATIDPPECFALSGLNRRMLDDAEAANINLDVYPGNDNYKKGRDILDVVGAEDGIGDGTALRPTGGIFWYRNDGTTAPDTPVFGSRSIDACANPAAAISLTGPKTVTTGDLDNDGDIDVVAGWPTNSIACIRPDGTTRPAGNSEVRGYINNNDWDPPTWSPAAVHNVSPPGFRIYDIAGSSASYSVMMFTADIDSDGFLDVVQTETYTDDILWFENPCVTNPCPLNEITGAWTMHNNIDNANANTYSIDVGDIDLDGDIDIVAASNGTAATSVRWYENTAGDGSAFTKRTIATGAAAYSVKLANLTAPEGDRAPDIVATRVSGTTYVVWYKNTTPNSNIRFQVRSCDDASCDTEIFVGPDGTDKTFYTPDGVTGTIVENLKVPDNQYFQYKFFFYSNKGDATPEMNPKLTSVAVNYARTYYTDKPSIYPETPITYSRITDFDATLGPGNEAGATVTYQICRYAAACYYWNGSTWATAASAADSNDAATIKLNIGSFEDVIGHGSGQSSSYYFKAFLDSDGTALAELDQVVGESDVISLGVLTNPDADATYGVDDSVAIAWSSYDCEGTPCGTLRLEYSVDSTNGSDGAWTLITELDGVTNGTPSSPASFNWLIPGGAQSGVSCAPPTTLTDCTSVRVKDKNVPVIMQWSGRFKVTGITGGLFTVNNPTGTDVFVVGDPMTINWNYSGSITEPVRLDYTLDNGSDGYANNIDTGLSKGSGGAGSYNWSSIPNSAVSAQAKIRIRDSAGTPIDGFSSGNFKIKGITELKTPSPGMAAGEIWAVGVSRKIEWKTTGLIPNVKLQYSLLGDFTDAVTIDTVADTTNDCSLTNGDSTGCYNWTIPDVASSAMKIRVVDSRAGLENYSGVERSTNAFTVRGSIYLNQTGDTPVSSTIWQVGTNVMFNWHSSGVGAIPNVKIEYSKSGGALADWETVAASATNGQNGSCTPPANVGSLVGGCYEWGMTASPDRISTGPKVRISHSTDTNVTVTSDPFTVKGYLLVTEPGNTVTSVTADQDTPNITWNSIGNIASVNLYYSVDGGDWNLITTGGATLNDGSEAWTVPSGAVGKNVTIKVADADIVNHPVTEAESDPFDVKGKLAFSSIPSGTITVSPPNQTLEWSKSSTVTNIGLYYSIDGGGSWELTDSGTLVSPYAWTVPAGAVDKEVSLKIVDLDGVGGSPTHPVSEDDTVATPFAVKGKITLGDLLTGETPLAGLTIAVGDSITMDWTDSGITTFDLFYKIGAGSDTPIAACTGIATNSCTFNALSDMVGSNVTLIVKDADTANHPATASAYSDSFNVKGALTIIAQPVPADDTAKSVGDGVSIGWSTTGNITSFDVWYSVDGGAEVKANSSPIASSPYVFPAGILPGMIGNNVRLKVKDANLSNPETASAASNSMDVSGTVAISTQPANAGETLTIGGANRTIEWSDVGITNFDVVYKIGAGSENAVTGCSNIAANTCTFALADAMVGKNLTVIVKDADTTNHPQVASPPVSNAFNVKGALTITTQPAPANNTPKVVGNSVSMNWSANATTVNSYHLYYVIGGAETYVNYHGDSSPILAAQLPVSFNLLPEMVGTGVSLKAYDANADHPVTASALSNSMDISGTIPITSQPVPADDTAKNVGDNISISWSGPSGIINYDVYYSIDGGADVAIAACNDIPAATSACTFSILPAMVGNNVRLKVKDYDPAHPVTVSSGSNSMDVSGTIAITAQPANADETLTIGGANRTIEWSDVGITNFDVVYKIGAGSENAVTGCSNIAANTCTFALVSAMVGKNLTVIVKDADTTNHPQVASPPVSNAFNVKGALTITTQPVPANNTPKVVGDSVSMNWSANATTVNSYHLYYVIGGAETYVNYNGDSSPILAAQLPVSFNLLQAMVATGVSLKVYDANADHPVTVSALSNSMDISGAIPITSQPVPADDTAKNVGDSVSIAWSGPSGIVGYDVYYSIDGGADVAIAACNDIPAATSACTFSILPAMVGNNVRLKVKDYDPAHPVTVSSGSNSMDVSGTIAITAQPAGADEILTIGGANRTIEWSDVGISNFDVVYKIGAGSENAVSGCSNITANSCTFALADAMVGKNLTVIVKDADTTNHPQVASPPASNAFNVKGVLTITTQPVPANNTPKMVGDSVSMNWSANATTVNSYHLYHVIAGVETYLNYNGDGTPIESGDLPISFNLLPEMVGTGVSLKVYDANADHPVTASALSNSMDISGTISITGQPVPADNTAKSAGDSLSIGWSANGNITQFDLYYSIDSGADVKINASPLTTSPYTFPTGILPAMVGNNVRLIVKDADLSHPVIASTASNSMDVSGTIAITAQPANADEILTIGGANRTIEWSDVGLTNFDVVYKIGAGSENAVSGCSNIATNNCTFALVSAMVGKNLTIIVKDATATHPQVLSPPVSNAFNVKGALTITTQPVAGNNTPKVVGDSVSMNWSSNATTVNSYHLYYVIAGVETYVNYHGDSSPILAAQLPASFNLLPEMVGTGVSLKVYDANADHPTTASALSNSMDISGAISITSQPVPADDTAKNVGDSVSVAWSGPSGIVGYDVYYSIDGGADVAIAACDDVPAATSACTFSILPAMVGNNVRLKVKDYDPAHPASVSAGSNSMDVSGTIAITAQPANADETLTIGGANRTIEWSDVGLTNFDVFYKIGSGSENAVTGCSNIAANSCTFALVDAMVGKNLTVIVKDADTTNHPQVASPPASNAFNVKGALTITTQPVAGNNTPKVVGDSVSMNWSSNATTVNSYHLYYVIAGVETYVNYHGDSSPIVSGDLPISFNLLSEMVGTGVSLKVYDANADHPTTASALSNSMDIGGTISITSQPVPADDTAKSVGDGISIGWSTTGNITSFDVWYSVDGGAEVKANSSPIASSPYVFPAGILEGMVGNNVRMKVKDANLSNPATASAASNSMDVSGTIAITTQPAEAGELLTVGGANRTIEWSDVGLTNFDVFYKIGSGSENAVTGCSNIAANTCTFALVSAMVGKNLTVIVKDADTTNHPQVLSPPVSNAFNVKGALTITTQPVAANNTPKVVGNSVSMNWSSNATTVNSYHLYYVIGGAETYVNYNGDSSPILAAQLPASFNLLPEMVGTGVSLKVYDANADHPTTASALSNSMDISGTIPITSQPVPVDDTAKNVGDSISIAWSGPSGIVNYDVYYSIDGGADVAIAACNDVPAATSACTFSILPAMVGNNVRLKVKDYDPAHPATVSTGSNSMDVSGTIAITAQPAGADEILTIGGANRTIEWSDVGITNFDVVYKIGAGSENAVTGCSNITANGCTFALADAMVGKNLTVIVKDADTTNHPQVLSPPVSNAFNVKGALTITTQPAPANNTPKVVGDSVSMNWSAHATTVNS
ncbi:MAG: hypothetical protein WC551_12600, partial [Patescibacteria group bacterium]